ncbi:MAG TPA: C_GCAxxG_C_C family protein [Chloroflexi bacterium]|nr:C_GCAxxG_C_C family protein [Chloroflexota bacterium]
MIAGGDHYLNPIPEVLVKASCPLGGGIGGCREDVCGLVTGGILIMGAIWGRTSPDEDDKPLYELARRFRQYFIDRFDTSVCDPIRKSFPESEKPCAPLVEDATRLLITMIEEAAQDEPFRSKKK